MSVKNGEAALLLEDGTTTYRRMDAKPGTRVEIPDTKASVISMGSSVKIAACAACAAIFIGGGFRYEIITPVSYVTEDVNPSIEYSLNRRDHITTVIALNDDAEDIVNETDLRGMTLTEAVTDVNSRLSDEDYLEDDGYVLFSVTSDSDSHAQRLESELSELMANTSEKDVTYNVLLTTEDDRKNAKEHSMSAGRYQKMIDEYGKSAADDEALISRFQSMPIPVMLGEKTVETDTATPASETSDPKEKTVIPAVTNNNGAKNIQKDNDTAEADEDEDDDDTTEDAGNTAAPTPKTENKTENKPAARPQTQTPAVESNKAPDPGRSSDTAPAPAAPANNNPDGLSPGIGVPDKNSGGSGGNDKVGGSDSVSPGTRDSSSSSSGGNPDSGNSGGGDTPSGSNSGGSGDTPSGGNSGSGGDALDGGSPGGSGGNSPEGGGNPGGGGPGGGGPGGGPGGPGGM